MSVNYDRAEDFAATINDELLEAWNNGNRAEYSAAYKEFVEFFELPQLTSDRKNSFEVVSANNGASLGYRKRTTDEEGKQILARAKAAHQELKKLPIKLRQEMLQYFLDNTFPKIALAAAIAQTSCMGKAISESKAEVTGKGKSWFDFATSDFAREYIENYETKSGFDVTTAEGLSITSQEQLAAYKGAVIVNKYPKAKSQSVKNAEGSGVSIEQPPSNYVALTFPGLTLPILVGNACITKLPTSTPDAFEIIRMAFLYDVKEFLIKRKIPHEVIVAGLCQTLTNRGWERVANTFRLVGGIDTGYKVYQSRMESDQISEEDKKRTCMELAGDNVLYIHDDISDSELEVIANNYLARVSSNSGMICTRVNLVMCKGNIYEKFVALIEKKIAGLENQIGNPHDSATKQGALINGNEYLEFKESLHLNRGGGARVVGGKRLFKEKGGIFVSAAVSIWDNKTKEFYKKIRSEGKEIFAPTSNIIQVSGVEEAAEITNLSKNSLSSAISSHEAKVQEYFVNHTKLGSYNINNPKHASDNSAGGAHLGHYPNMPYNGPTGSVAHIAHHLNVPLNDPEYSVWIAREDADKLLHQLGVTFS